MAKDKNDKPEQAQQAPPAPPQPPAARPERTRTVREWTEALGVRRAIVAGAGALAHWTADSALTEAAFRAGVRAYETRPLGGHPQAPKEKIVINRPGSEQ